MTAPTLWRSLISRFSTYCGRLAVGHNRSQATSLKGAPIESGKERIGFAMAQALAARPSLAAFSKEKKRLLEIIKEKSFLKGKLFTLASGEVSDYYLDMKPTMFDPEGAALCAEIVNGILALEPGVTAIGGLELGAVPIITTVAARSWSGPRPITGFVVRKEKKGHGTDKKIDGNFQDNSTVILLEDVTTKGGSVMEAVRAVRERGGKVKKIITIVDRLEGAKEKLGQEGIELVPVFTKADLYS
jgi:orotate phosphoribosyltransferase